MTIRFHQLDLNLLVALDALLTERSITSAARRLHLSQSAMSGILARLREYFADELLVKVGRNMMPSPLALDLIGHVRHVLQTVNSTIVTRTSFEHATSHRHFKICASDFVRTVLLTQVAQRVARLAPHITLEFTNLEEDPQAQLDRGELDLLIMPEYLMGSEHPRESLFESRHACVVWAGNHLVKDSLTFKQYLELGHVVIRFGKRHVPGFEEWFIKRYGHTRRVEVITDDFNSIPQLIDGTLRVATMHERLAAFYGQYLDLRLLPPPFDISPMVEGMQWHHYLDGDQGHRWLRELVKSVATGTADEEAPASPAALRYST